MEIVYGLHRVGREGRIPEFRSLIADHEILTFHSAMAATAGRIYADLERAETPPSWQSILSAQETVGLTRWACRRGCPATGRRLDGPPHIGR
jgi:hypothetical protein